MDPLTDVGVAVAGEVATSVLAKIKKHVAYLYEYHDNLNALQEADGLLDAKIIDESKFSGEASRSLRDVSATVVKWRDMSKELHREAEKLIPRNKISRLRPWSRYSTSKHASELTPKIKEKVDSAPDFGTSYDRPTKEGDRFNLNNYMEFGSRLRIQNEVLEALRKDDVSMCSICGMGGMGKTMMAKKLVKIVEADRFFDKVAFVTVSEKPSLENIQRGIMSSLQLQIDESRPMEEKAKKLNDWLSNHRTLVVLDDVWWQLNDEDFENIGIPLGNNACKIFVTSRNMDECVKMGSNPNIPLKDLEEGEAQGLFEKHAGKDFEDTARQIVAECKGLPFAIATIARALKGKPLGDWKGSLKKLQQSNLPGISDMDQVCSKVKVSYDLLNDREAQSCLLLCCLFPEDYNIPVDQLVFYGWGLELFQGVDSLQEARDRVDSIVHKLRNSFLLLDGNEDGCVRLHDIVRDFAIFFSSKNEYPYLVRCENEMENWPENQPYEKCHAISFVSQKIKNPPVGLRCPNLKLLRLSIYECPDMPTEGLFEGMEELKVVDCEIEPLLPPLTVLKALRTLLIRSDSLKVEPYHFRQILGEGDMKNLEIFSLSLRYLYEIPVEIGLMCNLRCLRLDIASLFYIPPGVLSNLVKLEELELPLSFKDWGLQQERRNRFNASLDEIASLPLTSIVIGLRKSSTLAENIVKRVVRFRIHIEEDRFEDFDSVSNVLVLRNVDPGNGLVEWTSSLLRQCHILELSNVDLKNIMSQQLGGNNCYRCEYFCWLKVFEIESMGSLEEIFHGPYSPNLQQPCFPNLTKIHIGECPKLKRAFPLPVARELTQLESMEITDCSEMEEVFYEDQADNGNQVASTVQVNDPTIETETTTTIFVDQDKDEKSSVLCPTPTKFIQCLLPKGKQPKQLPPHQIVEESVKLVDEGKVDPVIVFPRLKLVLLEKLPKLRVVYDGNNAIECPSLEELRIIECNIIEGISYGSFSAPKCKRIGLVVRHLKYIPEWLPLKQDNQNPLLKELGIAECHEMMHLVEPDLQKTFFSSLGTLVIEEMDSLEEIWHGPYMPNAQAQSCFSHLTLIIIEDCPKVKHVFPLSVAIELTQLRYLNINRCREMEEIFFNDHAGDGNQTTMKENTAKLDENEVGVTTIFRHLEVLILVDLPKLRIFYGGNQAIESASLKELTILRCYELQPLSNGSFKAPNLVTVDINGEEYRSCGDDINLIVKKEVVLQKN